MSSEEKTEYKLSIDDCFRAFNQSFNRVKYFSCITNNIEVSSLPTSWDIQNPSGLNYMIKFPETDKEKKFILDGYKHFIHCYLVRDCIESFAISLDNLFFTLLLNGKKALTSQTLLDTLSDDEKDLLKTFKKTGLTSKEGKLQLLKTHFSIELTSNYKYIIPSLKDIRNCFAHSNGFVRGVDGKKSSKNKRKFIWKTINIFLKGKDTGKEFEIVFGEPLPEESSVCMRIENHEKSFLIGEQLSLSSSETYEIAFSLQLASNNLMQKIKDVFDITEK